MALNAIAGTLAEGWGSGTANFPHLISPAHSLQNQALADGSIFQAVTDDYAYSQIQSVARQADVSIVFVSADSGEGYISVDTNEGDRNNLTVWHDGETLIQKVAAYCNNTVVVIHSVGPVLVDSFIHHPNVTAVVWAGLPGQESGDSLTDILYGRESPGGKTPFTWGASREEYGTDLLYEPNGPVPQVDFTEGVFIDYRAFDKAGIEPIFEFGFGLSYTTFNYSDLQVVKTQAGPYAPADGFTPPAPTSQDVSRDPASYVFPANFSRVPQYIYPYLDPSESISTTAADDASIPPGAHDASPQPIPAAGGAPGGNPRLYDVLYEIQVRVSNTGTVTGEEVVQLYVSLGGPDDPPVVLRNFERVSIPAGQSVTVTLDLTRRDLSNWDIVRQDWVRSPWPKIAHVGSSSRKLPLQALLE
ncbi:MAG: hypothetical protein M1826_006142 [Phylliscum demangeonii]|nr:MAG: hypothetical protein M1826_006142 [Phylliscum demangeonii]